MTQITARQQRATSTVVAACFAVLLAQVAYSVPNKLNQTFQQEFQTTGAQLVWITSAFAIPMVVLQLTTGDIGDRFGRRRLLQAGALLTLLGSLLMLGADTVQMAWAGQVVAGLGAAALYPVSLAMLVAVSPTAVGRARAIALWAGFLSVGAAMAPAMAGMLVDAGHWRWTYLVVAAAAAVSILLTQRASDSSAPRSRALDVPGQVTLALGLAVILTALTQGTDGGLGRPGIVVPLLAGVALLVAFVVIERRTAEPIVNLAIFADRRYAVIAVATVVGMLAFMATCYAMTIWIAAIQGESALKLGLTYVVIQVPALLLVPVVARQIRTSSPRWFLTAGFALIATSALWCSTFDVRDMGWTRFLPPMLLLGVGFALSLGSLTAVAVSTVPARITGMASATTNLLRTFGFALAPILVAGMAGNRANDDLQAGIGGAIGASGLVPPYTQIVGGVAQEGGAIALNAMPVVPGAGDLPPVPMPASIQALALDSLGDAYSMAFVVAGLCAAAVAALTMIGLRGARGIEDEMAASADDRVLADG